MFAFLSFSVGRVQTVLTAEVRGSGAKGWWGREGRKTDESGSKHVRRGLADEDVGVCVCLYRHAALDQRQKDAEGRVYVVLALCLCLCGSVGLQEVYVRACACVEL